ncbi:MAG: hypothetical protein WDM76_09015 [Limisphaerales bacterium]
MKLTAAKWFFLLLLAVVLAGASGCTTTEPGNESVRPWNAPQGWENGLPIDMQQQRR